MLMSEVRSEIGDMDEVPGSLLHVEADLEMVSLRAMVTGAGVCGSPGPWWQTGGV